MPEPPELASLQLLVLVGERGSLTAAASALGTSQPAASKRIATLERRLGLRLLDRSRRGSALTAAGVLVCGWADRVLTELDTLFDGVEALRRRHNANLSVSASMTVAEHLLPTWLGELRRVDPELHVGLQVTNSARVCDLARQGSIDLGFIESPGSVPGLRSRVVARDRLVLVVSAGHRWARRRRPVGGSELARTPLVTREPGSGTRETAERALARRGLEFASPLLELGSSTAVRSAVLAGAGPALLSELVVDSDLASGTLVEAAVEGVDLTRTLRAVWRADRTPDGPAADLLHRALRGRGSPAAGGTPTRRRTHARS
jgi:DNA-binding transcriptional LysR family regulator